MAYGFGSTLGTGTTDRIQTATSRAWPTLSTLSVWAYRNGAGGANVGTITQHSGVVHYLRNNEASTVMQFSLSFAGGTANIWTFPRPGTGVWSHILVTYDGSNVNNDPVCYVDGVSQTVTNTQRTTGTLHTTTGTFGLGNRASDNATVWDGSLAEWALWSRILTAADAVSLARGYSPQFLAYGLVEYQPMVRGFGNPVAAQATTNGTPLVQPHPRVIYPSRLHAYKSTYSPASMVRVGRPPGRGMWRGVLRGTR